MRACSPPPQLGTPYLLGRGLEKKRLVVVRRETGLPAAGGTEARQQEGLPAKEQ